MACKSSWTHLELASSRLTSHRPSSFLTTPDYYLFSKHVIFCCTSMNHFNFSEIRVWINKWSYLEKSLVPLFSGFLCLSPPPPPHFTNLEGLAQTSSLWKLSLTCSPPCLWKPMQNESPTFHVSVSLKCFCFITLCGGPLFLPFSLSLSQEEEEEEKKGKRRRRRRRREK